MGDPLEGLVLAQQQSREAAEAEVCRRNDLADQIAAGTYTTKDPVKDFLMVAFKVLENEGLEKTIRDIQENVNGNIGEQVLFIKEDYRLEGTEGCFGSRYPVRTERHLKLGTATKGVEFDYPHKKILLPMEAYAEYRNVWRAYSTPDDGWSRHDGSLPLSDEELFVYGRGMRDNDGYSDSHLLVGNEIVEAYFRLNPSFEDQTMEMITKGKLASSIFNDRVDVTYNEGLRLLGLNVPLDFRIAFDRRHPERQRELFQQIYELSSREPVDGRALKEQLEYVVQVGLHTTSLILSGSRPGITVSSRPFLEGLCKEYSVELPKEKK